MSAFVAHGTISAAVRRQPRLLWHGSSVTFSSQSLWIASPCFRKPLKRAHVTTFPVARASTVADNGAPAPEAAPAKVGGPLLEIAQGVVKLGRPLWAGKRRRVAFLWTAAALILAGAATGYAVALSMIQKFFWNVLSTKDVASFGKLMALYGAAVVVGPFILALFMWVKERLALMWRRTLTEYFMGSYFSNMNYYSLSIGLGDIDNPDQRIAEDVKQFTSRAVRFITVMGVALFDVIIFSVILYRVYSPLWYLLIAYSTVGTLLIGLTGNRLVQLNRAQVQKEADFRFGLVRVRESTESVAFYAGEKAEQRELTRRFNVAFLNCLSLLGLRRNVEFLSASFRYYAQVVPMLVVGPQYFAGNIMLGTISQVYFSFNHVLQSLGLVISEFNALAEFGAGVRRLKDLSEVLERQGSQQGASTIETTFDTTPGSKTLRVQSLTVETPNQPSRAIVRDISFEVSHGKNLVVLGRSGIGKSSLMRAVCGLWQSGSGHVTRPSTEFTLFLPQRPFIMLGTLRENVIYPSTRDDVLDKEVEDALEQVNLRYLLERPGGLKASGETLSRRLSLGEQQRLAFARVLISRPKLIVADESTSALDLKNEALMYSILRRMGITYISVSNRPSVLDWHDEALRIMDDGSWATESIESVRVRLRDESPHS